MQVLSESVGKRAEYERIRSKYLRLGITLKDLYYYFEEPLNAPRDVKARVEKIVKREGVDNVLVEFWRWWDLAEEINPDELKFLYED